MNNKLNIKIGSKYHNIFLQNGFYSHTIQKMPIHKHSYAEIHIVTNGIINFKVGDTIHSTTNGNLFFVPANTYHCAITENPNARRIAFQIDCDEHRFFKKQVQCQTVMDFLNEIEKCKTTKDYTVVSAYISLFFSQLYPEGLQVHPVNDYPFLFREFFSRRYNEDLQLSDLAQELHLSERQTERLLIKYTGHTFRQELSTVRIDMARHLLSVSDMRLTEIALLVGYRSYSGFWKAMKKHKSF